MPHLGTYICACTRVGTRDGWPPSLGVGRGRGLGLGLEPVQPLGLPEDAKGAQDGDGTTCGLVSWKPNANAEGLAGRTEATQVCSGSRGPGHSIPRPREGLGLRGVRELGRGAGAKGPLLVGKKPTAPGIPRWSPMPDPA